MCTPPRPEATFGPTGPQTERETPRRSTFCFAPRKGPKVETKAFGTDFRRDSRSGAPLGVRPQPQNTTDSWSQSGRIHGQSVGAPGPPQRVPGEFRESPRDRETRRTACFYENLQKLSFVKMCTPLQCQAHFGEPGVPPGPRNTTDSMFFMKNCKN